MYVLKGVFAFDSALEKSEKVSYRQKLQFVYTPEAFAIECRPFVQFIRNWVRRNKNRYVQRNYYGYSYGQSQAKLREIPLLGDDLEELLEAVGSGFLVVNVNGTGEKDYGVLSVSFEMLPRKILSLAK